MVGLRGPSAMEDEEKASLMFSIFFDGQLSMIIEKDTMAAERFGGTDGEFTFEQYYCTYDSSISIGVDLCHSLSSVAQSCPTLCDPMNCSTPGLPVHHQLPEFTQTHVHRVSDAIQASHPLSSPSPPAPNPSQHQSLFQ